VGLRRRIALSYVVTTAAAVSLVLAAFYVAALVFLSALSARGSELVGTTAGAYAQTAAMQGATISAAHPFPLGSTDPRVTTSTIDVSNSGTALQVPYLRRRVAGQLNDAVAVVVDPAGAIAGTSYPAGFPAGARLAQLVPAAAAALDRALAGAGPGEGDAATKDGRVQWSLRPVVAAGGVTGAVYVQAPEIGQLRDAIAAASAGPALTAVVVLVVVFTPVGITFGLLTMRGPVRRLRALVEANVDLAAGGFSRRVRPGGRDEVGQLERQFNATAAQLEDAVQAQRQLAATNAQLAERARLARDLHESISQELFSMRLMLGSLEPGGSEAELAARIGQLRAVANDAIRQMRALLLELRPVEVGPADLGSCLEELSAAYGSRLGILVDCRVEPVELDQARTEGLLGIAREALANVARHADASRVELALERADGVVRLTVADDGAGFDPGLPESRRGLGLRLMRERGEELGGRVELDSGPGRGTRLLVTVPVGTP